MLFDRLDDWTFIVTVVRWVVDFMLVCHAAGTCGSKVLHEQRASIAKVASAESLSFACLVSELARIPMQISSMAYSFTRYTQV